MSRSFEETRQMADETINDMERRHARMTRTYNTYVKHGAVNAAAELMTEMETLDCEIQAEQHHRRMAFN